MDAEVVRRLQRRVLATGVIDHDTEWLMSDDSSYVFSFRCCCESLDLDADAIRKRVTSAGYRARRKLSPPGVYYRADRKKWVVRPCIGGRQRYLGVADTVEAALAILTAFQLASTATMP